MLHSYISIKNGLNFDGTLRTQINLLRYTSVEALVVLKDYVKELS